jgi:hypothetical protein
VSTTAITSNTTGTASSATGPGSSVPVSVPRRAALGVAGLLSSFLPLSFGISATLQLLTGTEADHRFHQVTGQGVLVCALWLAALAPLLLAGLRGRRPSTQTGLHLLAFLGATAVAGILAPEGGAWMVALVGLVTNGLLWLALPLRPRLRGAFDDGLDPVLAPVTLLMAALVTPFALDQADLQHAMGDEHAEMGHYFDMAWVVFVLVALTAAAALSASARRLAVLSTAGLVVVGAARTLFTPDVTWSVLAMALGSVGLLLAVLRSRSGASAGTAA